MRAILQLDTTYCGGLAARAPAPLNNEYIKPRSSENAMRGINGAWKRAGGGEKLVPELNPQLIIFPKENGALSTRVRALTSPFESPFNFRAAVFY